MDQQRQQRHGYITAHYEYLFNKKTTCYKMKQAWKHYVCHDVTWQKLVGAIFEIDPNNGACQQKQRCPTEDEELWHNILCSIQRWQCWNVDIFPCVALQSSGWLLPLLSSNAAVKSTVVCVSDHPGCPRVLADDSGGGRRLDVKWRLSDHRITTTRKTLQSGYRNHTEVTNTAKVLFLGNASDLENADSPLLVQELGTVYLHTSPSDQIYCNI